MGQTVICRVLPNGERANKIVVLDVRTAAGNEWQLKTAQPQNLKLQYGDRLRCVSGSAVVLINPGTRAGAFILKPQLPAKPDWKERVELVINDETTRAIARGQIVVSADIGTTQTATGATTR